MTKTEFKTKIPKMNIAQLKKLGFQYWDQEKRDGKYLMLIPQSLYNSIPQGFEVTTIGYKKEKFDNKTSDNDQRYGSLAYGVMAKK